MKHGQSLVGIGCSFRNNHPHVAVQVNNAVTVRDLRLACYYADDNDDGYGNEKDDKENSHIVFTLDNGQRA